jgi:hypothetical protein
MAFDSVTIQVTNNGGSPLAQWRQDCAVGSVVGFSLSSTVGVNTYQWLLIGRPEGSGAGGGGPEPISLGTASSASITLDLAGTYIVGCLINGGAPNRTQKTCGCAVLASITDPLGRALRLIGAGESSEDNADALVAQGWDKMLNRWLMAFANAILAGTDKHDVRARAGDSAPAFLDTKLAAGANITLTPVTNGGVQQLQISSSGGGGGSSGILHTPIGTATETDGLVTLPTGMQQGQLAITSTPYFYGVAPTGFNPGDHILVYVDNPLPTLPIDAIHGRSTDPYLPLWLPAKGDGTAENYHMIGPTLFEFMLDPTGSFWMTCSIVTFPTPGG